LFVAGLLEFLAHVDDFDLRERALFNAVGQLDKRILIFLRVEIRLERWSCRAEHDDSVGHLGAHDGGVAGVVAWRFFLLVGSVVFLVDDDEGEVGDGSEDSGARADDHARFASLDAVPLLGPLAVREPGVEDRDFVAEDLMQVGSDCWC
jgi:hypothetical protein